MSDPVTPEEARKDAAGLRAGGDPWPAEIIDSLAAQLEAARADLHDVEEHEEQLAAQLEEERRKVQRGIGAYDSQERLLRDVEAQLEAAQKAIAQLEADVEHRDEIIQRLRSGKAE